MGADGFGESGDGTGGLTRVLGGECFVCGSIWRAGGWGADGSGVGGGDGVEWNSLYLSADFARADCLAGLSYLVQKGLHIYAECQRYVLCDAAEQAGSGESGADDGGARSDQAGVAGGRERIGDDLSAGGRILPALDGVEG